MDDTTTSTIHDGNVVAWFETIGPERAKELIRTYEVDYRKLRPSYVDGLSRDMENGRWHFDGSPVRIDEAGNLFDAQHRLHAVIMSGTAQRFLIIAGLPVSAYNTADTGLSRIYGDTLRRRGYVNVSLRAALVKLLGRWYAGRSLDDTKRFTTAELEAIHDQYVDGITRAVAMALSTAKKSHVPPAVMALAWFVLADIDNEKANTFLVSVAEGENLRNGQPAYTLRERLRNSYEFGLTRNEYLHLIFSAWNAFREERTLTRVVLPTGTVTRDKMALPV